jgi:hypothetical protein
MLIYEDIDSRLKKDLQVLREEGIKEKASLDSLLLSQHTERLDPLLEYRDNVDKLVENYEIILKDAYKNHENEKLSCADGSVESSVKDQVFAGEQVVA